MNIERRKIAELKNDPANARKHSPRNLKAIRDSLDVFGQQKPIVIDSRGVVIAGNGTLEAARELGWDEIAVAVTDLDPAHAQAFGIADNRTAELAEWDTDILSKLLEGMDSDLADILSMDDLELPDSIDGGGQGEGLTDPDEVPEPPEEPITQTGDLWLLGEHRLLCGDSTSAEDMGRLMGGERAELALTDPPYGLGDTKSVKNNYISYDDTRENLVALIPRFMSLLSELSSRQIITPGNTNHRLYPSPAWTMAWFTPAGVGTGPWGFCCWQPILCYGKDYKLANGLGSHPDAIVHTEAAEKNLHPCPKPVKFWMWLMERNCGEGDLVIDPFLGSGTTLIAAEQLGRKCYGMEIDPKYCDVIVKRWEDFTGKTATRETASQTATRENERT